MRRRIAAVALSAVTLGVPAAAQGATQGKTDDHKPYEARYLELRRDYVTEFGLKEAGRNIVRYGYREQDGDVHVARKAEVDESADRIYASLHPQAPVTAAPAAETAAAETASATTTSGSAAAPSSTAQCESGGSYTAVNPAGYYGAYQFDQQTWDAYAPDGYQGVNPASAPPAVQDQAAANVPYDAWPSC
jgi:Transglycosylase-like domain